MPDFVARRKVPVMKVGTHTSSDGDSVEISETDLDGMVRNFSDDISGGYRPPVVLGHPKSDEPRYGDCLSVSKEKGVLYADFGVIPELDGMLKKGQYPERSLRLAKKPDGTWRIKHLGLLGVVPPAVQGLPSYQFSAAEGQEVTVDFSEASAINIIGSVFQRIRDFFIENYGQDSADRIVGPYEIDYMKNTIPDMEYTDSAVAPAVASFSEKEERMPGKEKELEDKLRDAERQIADFSAGEKEKDAENASLKQQIVEMKAEGRKKDFSAFCEKLKAEGKLSPAMIPVAMDFMEILSGTETYDFAEGDGKKAGKPVDRFKALLESYPKIVEFSEVATKDKGAATKTGTAGEKLDAIAREKMKADGNLTYSIAFSEAQTENKELSAEYAAEIER